MRGNQTSPTKHNLIQRKVSQTVRDINKAWLHRDFAKLDKYLNRDVVMVQPGFNTQLKGRRACVRSYQEFMATSTVERYRESRYRVHCFDNTAIAAYHFDIVYKTGGKHYYDTGWDIFVLVRREGKWQAVWRTLIPSPPT